MTPAALTQTYRSVFAALLVVASAQAVMSGGHHVVLLAGAEIAGALLFAWRRCQLAGAVVLVLVFAIAQAISVAHGERTTHLLQYAATTIFIVLLDHAVIPAKERSRDESRDPACQRGE